MNVANLEKLAAFLDTLPEQKFNFAKYASLDWTKTPDEPQVFQPTPIACGTTACALGWATTVPEFKMALASNGDDFLFPCAADWKPDDDTYPWDVTCAATLATFGLTPEETEYLFVPSEDHGYGDEPSEYSYYALPRRATPKQVAAHIRDFLDVGIRYND